MDLASSNRHRIHFPHQEADPFFISKYIGEIGELAPYIYAGGMGGKPYPCRVAVEKQFRGRRPAGSKAPEILRQDVEEEEQAISGGRDDEVREDGMGMAAGADEAHDAEAVSDSPSAHEGIKEGF